MIKELTLIGSLLSPSPAIGDMPQVNTEANLMEQLKQIEVAKEEIKKREEIIFKQIEEERQKREEEEKQRIEEQKKKEEAERIRKEMENKKQLEVINQESPKVEREESQEEPEDNWQEGHFSAYYAANNTMEGGLVSATGHSLIEGITFQGYRIIAAPPEIPFYSIVEIEVNGWRFKGVVLDRGGAIKGNKFDILHRNGSEANAFGKQNGKYRVIGKLS
ncbi:3D domain-containing protein [Bacillus thuringiensis]